MNSASIEDSIPQLVAERKYLKPVGVPNILVQIGLTIVFLTTLYTVFISRQITDFGAVWSVVFSAASLAISIWVTPRHFTLGYLMSMLPFLINWRIAAMADGSSVKGQWVIGENRPWLLMIVSAIVFVPFALQFFAVWHNDSRHLRSDAWLENLVWGATLVRVYFGFNELGHATEKIFAGYHSWSHMTNDVFAPLAGKTFPPFTLLSSVPGLFVVIAGLIEFALAIGIAF